MCTRMVNHANRSDWDMPVSVTDNGAACCIVHHTCLVILSSLPKYNVADNGWTSSQFATFARACWTDSHLQRLPPTSSACGHWTLCDQQNFPSGNHASGFQLPKVMQIAYMVCHTAVHTVAVTTQHCCSHFRTSNKICIVANELRMLKMHLTSLLAIVMWCTIMIATINLQL